MTYTAACPQCNGDAEWTVIPLVKRLTEIPGAHPTTIGEYRIYCNNCDRRSD